MKRAKKLTRFVYNDCAVAFMDSRGKTIVRIPALRDGDTLMIRHGEGINPAVTVLRAAKDGA